jgi:YYY domain-containing protein
MIKRDRLKISFKQILYFVIVAWAIVISLFTLSIYRSEHVYVTASRWIYENLPQGSILLGVEWDDRLPISLPEYLNNGDPFPDRNDTTSLGLYDSDSEEKVRKLAEKFSRGDFLVLPTQRLQGSVPRLPEEFPQTTNFFRLLFSDNLGYKLIATFKERPRFFSFEVFTDLADESLTVYDHPKVTIFQNFEHLSADEIMRRIYHAEEFGVLPDLNAIMSAEKVVNEPLFSYFHPGSSTIVFQLISWILLIETFTFIGNILAFIFSRSFVIRGIGLGRTLGIAYFTIISFLLAWFQLIKVSRYPLLSLVVVSILIALKLIHFRCTLIKKIYLAEEFKRSSLIFYSVFIAFLLLRSLNPEIYWGEKPMDFSFLNFFIRNETLPPDDPWAAGHQMHYYYLGTFLISIFHKIGMINPSIGYNFSVAMIAGLLTVSLFSLFRILNLSSYYAVLGALFVALGSNLEILYLYLFGGRSINFDTFWSTARILRSPAINEYPFWTMIFADLHAHFISLPVAVSLITLLIDAFRSHKYFYPQKLIFIIPLWCSLLFFNTWDFITIGLLIGLLMLLLIYKFYKKDLTFLNNLTFSVAVCLTQFVVFFGVFLATKSNHISFGWVNENEGFNSPAALFHHFGVFFLLILFSQLKNNKHFWSTFVFPFIISNSRSSFPLGFVLLAVMLGCLGFNMFRKKELNKVIAMLLISCSVLLVASELFFLMDRMNTIFKSYNMLWIFLGVTAVTLSFNQLKQSSLRYKACLGILIAFSLLSSVLNSYAMLSTRRTQNSWPSLNGTNYLPQKSPGDAAIISWIQQHVPLNQAPPILEAFGESYQDYARISMNTGLPTLLGWSYHVQQRGLHEKDLQARISAVNTIYNTTDIAEALEILGRYHIQYVVISSLEEQKYNPLGLKKFSDNKKYFIPVLNFQGGKLFKLFYADLNL